MKLDRNIVTAIELFFKYGFKPGSFTTHLLHGNRENAIASAHPNIKNDIDDYFVFREALPHCILGNNMLKWKGITVADECLLTAAVLQSDIARQWYNELTRYNQAMK